MSNCLRKSRIYAGIPAQKYCQKHKSANLTPRSAKFNLVFCLKFHLLRPKHKGQPLKLVELRNKYLL
jgi:hypothetical protein